MTDAIPAATLVLFRDRPDAAPELLMVERAAAMAFAGGALVFPGGRIDPADRLLAADPGPGPSLDADDAAARVAAIRETLEETGLAVAIDPLPGAAPAAAMRRRLHAGDPLGDVLDGRRLRLDALVPFARWRPPHNEVRVFDTRFYLAAVPDGAGAAVPDAGETVAAHWATAADTLAAADRGEASLVFPTRRNLERLAQFVDFAAAVAHCAAFPPVTICPFAQEREGVTHLCIPDGLGYPVTSEPLAGIRRA